MIISLFKIFWSHEIYYMNYNIYLFFIYDGLWKIKKINWHVTIKIHDIEHCLKNCILGKEGRKQKLSCILHFLWAMPHKVNRKRLENKQREILILFLYSRCQHTFVRRKNVYETKSTVLPNVKMYMLQRKYSIWLPALL